MQFHACIRNRHKDTVNVVTLLPLYVNIKASPLDKGLEQAEYCQVPDKGSPALVMLSYAAERSTRWHNNLKLPRPYIEPLK